MAEVVSVQTQLYLILTWIFFFLIASSRYKLSGVFNPFSIYRRCTAVSPLFQ